MVGAWQTASAPKRQKFLTFTVANTQLPVILSHRRSNTVSLETYPLYSFAYNQVLNKVVHLHQYHQCYEDLSQIIIIVVVITITNNSIIIIM